MTRSLIVDIDNHYYEPDDAFTRYLPSEFRDRAYHIRREGQSVGRPYFGDEPAFYLEANPADSVGRAGAYVNAKDDRYQPLSGDDLVEPGQLPWYVEREARLEWMDQASIEAAVMWPSIGLTVENQMRSDPAACVANLRSFNRWIDDEWGFNHADRIFGVPWLTLIDLDAAVEELEYVLDHGARIVHLLFAPVNGRALGDPYFDPFWSRLAEAGVPIGFHGADSGYHGLFADAFGEPTHPPAHRHSAFQRAVFWERPIMDALASLVLHNVFGRHPTLQAVSVENGSEWAGYLLRVMDKAERSGAFGEWLGGRIDDRPSEIFKRHVSVAPNDDDDIRGLVDLLGADRVLLGSDYPHPEGFPEPAKFLDGHDLTADEALKISRVNAAGLLRLGVEA